MAATATTTMVCIVQVGFVIIFNVFSLLSCNNLSLVYDHYLNTPFYYRNVIIISDPPCF